VEGLEDTTRVETGEGEAEHDRASDSSGGSACPAFDCPAAASDAKCVACSALVAVLNCRPIACDALFLHIAGMPTSHVLGNRVARDFNLTPQAVRCSSAGCLEA